MSAPSPIYHTKRMPPAVEPEVARKLLAMDWQNAHTARIRQATGDPRICMAFSPQLQCWVLARMVDVLVGHTKETPGQLMSIPFVWKEWRTDDTRQPLSPNDPQLVPYILDCDTSRGQVAQRVQDDLDAAELHTEKESERKLKEAAEAWAPHLQRQLQMQMARDGYVHHRDTGNDAKRISSAALWNDPTKAKADKPLVTLT